MSENHIIDETDKKEENIPVSEEVLAVSSTNEYNENIVNNIEKASNDTGAIKTGASQIQTEDVVDPVNTKEDVENIDEDIALHSEDEDTDYEINKMTIESDRESEEEEEYSEETSRKIRNSLGSPDSLFLLLFPEYLTKKGESSSVLEQDQENEIVSYDDSQKLLHVEDYKIVKTEQDELKRKNNFLQKKLVELYKKRKQDDAFKADRDLDFAEENYNAQLKEFYETYTDTEICEKEMTDKNCLLETVNESKQKQLENIMNQIVKRINEITTEHTDSYKTKSLLAILDQYKERVFAKVDQIKRNRLKLIILRTHASELEAIIKELNTIGGNMTTANYEELLTDNVNYADKVEDRNIEMQQFREKCTKAMHILSHVKEKIRGVEANIATERKNNKDIDQKIIDVRELLNWKKQHRDNCRAEILQIKEMTGLLLYPDLLIDFQDMTKYASEKRKILNSYKKSCNVQKLKLDKYNKILREMQKPKVSSSSSSSTDSDIHI